MTEEQDRLEDPTRNPLETWAREVLAATQRLRQAWDRPVLSGADLDTLSGVEAVERIASAVAESAPASLVKALAERPNRPTLGLKAAAAIVEDYGRQYLRAADVYLATLSDEARQAAGAGSESKGRHLLASQLIHALTRAVHPSFATLSLGDVQFWLAKYSPKHPPGRTKAGADSIANQLNALAGYPLEGPRVLAAQAAPTNPAGLGAWDKRERLAKKRKASGAGRVRDARKRAR